MMAPYKKSVVWRFFIKKDTTTVICKLCRREFKFNSNNSSTSNMRAHLRCKHPSSIKSSEFIQTSELDIGNSSLSGGSPEVDKNHIAYNEITYEKIIVPTEMRSIYWRCYGFPATGDGVVLTRERVICVVCKKVLSYKGNTTNLKLHLQRKHAEQLVQLDNMKKSEEFTLLKKTNNRRDGGVHSTNLSGSFFLGDGLITEHNMEIMNEDYEASLNFEHSTEIQSTVLNTGCKNKDQNEMADSDKKSIVDVLDTNTQQDTIEFQSLHPFMIPMEQKSVSDSLTEFIITDIQMTDVVESRGFQRLLASLKSPCEIPSKNKLVEEIIPRIYDTFKESVQDVLQQVTTDMVLSVEEWQSNTAATYVTFSCNYYQDKTDNLINKVLSTVHIPSSADSAFWVMVFDNLVGEWNLKLNKMTAVVCASEQQELLNLFEHKGLIVIPCLMRTLQDICTKVCFNQEDVSEIVNKCRTLVHTIYVHSNALAALRIQDHLMMLDETPLVSDYPKLWLSTYNMLEALLTRRQVIHTILDNINPSAYNRDSVTFSDEEWVLIEDVTTVLEPFKVTLMTLSEERIPLVSLLKPLLCQLLNGHLKTKDEDSVNVQIFKSALKTLLSDRYNKVEVDQFLTIATTLDPRFKSLPTLADEAKTCMEGPIKDSLVKLIDQRPKLDVKSQVEDGLDKKKPKLLGMVMMLGEMCPATPSAALMTSSDRANLELSQYQSEETAPLDQCPMAWWDHMAVKSPNLIRLVTKYTFVPAAAIPPGRIALDSQLIYESRRANLTPEVVDRIVFLNSNSSL